VELLTLAERETSDPNCKRCGGCGWVCENHLDKPWADMMTGPMEGACNCGAGAPCPSCNALALDAGLLYPDSDGKGGE